MKKARNLIVSGLLAAAAPLHPASAAEYTIAIVQSMTGPLAFLGVPLRDGFLMSAEELNAKQALGPGNSLKVVWADDAGDRAQAVTAIQRYAADPSVLAIVGPTAGGIAMAGLSVANDRKIPAIATTNSRQASAIGPYGFLLAQPPDILMPYLVRYAADVLKVKTCATIGLNDNEAVKSMEKLFVDEISGKGVKIVTQEQIKANESDFLAVTTKVANIPGLDCILLSTFAPQVANIARQLKEAGMPAAVKLIGHTSAASPDLIKIGGQFVEGIYLIGDWVPGGINEDGKAFSEAFKKRYNVDADNWAAVGYSIARVVTAAIRNAGSDPTRDSFRDALTKVKDVPVIIGSGKYSYDDERVPHVGTQVLMVKNGQFIVAPQ